MEIRRAKEQDMEGINRLLLQVCLVHHKGRPDLFKYGAKKYTDEQLRNIIHDDNRPIFTAVDEENHVLGYAFCIFQQHIGDNILRIDCSGKPCLDGMHSMGLGFEVCNFLSVVGCSRLGPYFCIIYGDVHGLCTFTYRSIEEHDWT